MKDYYPVHMPEGTSPGQCVATFTTVISSMAIELGNYFNGHMTNKYGQDWFNNLEEGRVKQNAGYKAAGSFYDFSWIVNEPQRKYPESPLREFLPPDTTGIYGLLKDLRGKRNQWFHHHDQHNINSLISALITAQRISDLCSLELADQLEPILERVRELRAGTYHPDPTSQPSAAPQPSNSTEGLGNQTVAQLAVGAMWLGPLGSRKVTLSKAGNLIDSAANANVTGELTDAQRERYLALWKSLNLGWLWIDELGSVAAHVDGTLRMVGYWGENADDSVQDQFAKFLLPQTYEFTDSDFIDRASRQKLSTKNIGLVTKSTLDRARSQFGTSEIFRVTWDGDLITFTDEGPEYIGEVESKDWFPGHFPVPTA